MQKSDLTSTITGLHCEMDVGNGDVLGIQKSLLQNGCRTEAHTPSAGGSLPGLGYSPTSGGAGVWDRARPHRAGTPTPPTVGVCGQEVPHAQTRKGVCDPHSLGGGCVWVHKSVCVWHMLGSVAEGV